MSLASPSSLRPESTESFWGTTSNLVSIGERNTWLHPFRDSSRRSKPATSKCSEANVWNYLRVNLFSLSSTTQLINHRRVLTIRIVVHLDDLVDPFESFEDLFNDYPRSSQDEAGQGRGEEPDGEIWIDG